MLSPIVALFCLVRGHSPIYPFLIAGLRSEKQMWFMESEADNRPAGLQINNLCNISLPLEDSLGTTWQKQIIRTQYSIEEWLQIKGVSKYSSYLCQNFSTTGCPKKRLALGMQHNSLSEVFKQSKNGYFGVLSTSMP